MPSSRRLLYGPSAADRLVEARRWLAAQPRGERLLLLSASYESGAQLARGAALEGGSSFGWQRLTIGQAAAQAATRGLAELGRVVASRRTLISVCLRVVHELAADDALGRLQPLAAFPGLPVALAKTLAELRVAGVDVARLKATDEALARVLAAYESQLEDLGLADEADVFRLATQALASPVEGLSDMPLLMVDVPVRAGLEEAFVRALGHRAPQCLAVSPAGDEASLRRLAQALDVSAQPLAPDTSTPMSRLQQRLFMPAAPVAEPPGDAVELVSAAGESREGVELARRLLAKAREGVPFDRMAVLLRSPGAYRASIADALRRAEIPAWFADGEQVPEPSGRAFLALLACASEGISAGGFTRYLSLGQVPTPGGDDEDARPRVSPRHWERLIADARVIAGADRWHRRLEGLRQALAGEQLAFEHSTEDAPDRFRRDLEALELLEAVALPIVDRLAALPESATWGEWLASLRELATHAIRRPEHVLSVLAELEPMAPVGPVTLSEVRLSLEERLTTATLPEAARRDGCVFVGAIEAARGLSFDVVCVPGLAEKVFPQRISEDPLLHDEARAKLDAGLPTNVERAESERLLLRLAVGAASRSLVLSYPRLDARQGRPRVPSFYGLELMQAAEGRLPGYDELVRRSDGQDPTRLGWPAPRDALLAIDAVEHDLSLLDELLQRPAAEVTGYARHLLDANPHLARGLRGRARRALRRWTPVDGLVDPQPEGKAALAHHHLEARSYSSTALQLYASCPYRFFLNAVVRLRPREESHQIEDLDPMQYGSFVHEVQFRLLTRLRDEDRLPLRADTLDVARERLAEVLEEVAQRYRDELAPTVEQVWDDNIARIRADLVEWLRLMSEETDWTPWRFELSFGLGSRTGRDQEDSRDEAVQLPGKLQLRGSIDLVERRADGALRATDHKTGRKRSQAGLVIGGGETLQPVLYALALEQMFPGTHVASGRLDYCTSNGDFASVETPLDEVARQAAELTATTIGDALRTGFLPMAPIEARTCEWCDYLPVCGPGAHRRAARKPAERLAPLVKLRSQP